MKRLSLPILTAYSPRARSAWLLGAFLAGVYLVLAIPITPPGGHVERIQAALLNLNPGDLLGRGLPSLLVVLLLGGLVGAGLFLASAALAGWQPRGARANNSPGAGWLRYALPMLAVWTVYLLAFWPAMMSGDSLDVWNQVQTGVYNNGHPLFYIVIVWLLTRLWNSPTVVAVAQIVGISVLISWGLGRLRKHGLPGWAAWLTALVFAFAPINGAFMATFWKDIPYGAAVLGFSLLALCIVLEPRAWLGRWQTALALGLAAIPVGLLRYNGLVVAPLALLALALVYRSHWRTFAAALGIFVLGWGLVTYPLASALHVQKTSLVSGTLPMHHIAAHIHYGTPINAADRAVLENFMPLDEWHYYCYMVNPVMFNPAMDKEYALANKSKLNMIAVRLFLENPTVDILQTACAGSLVYRVLQPYDGYLYAAALNPDEQGGATYILENDQGVLQRSLLPRVSEWLIDLLESTRNGPLSWLFWRPAFSLYFLLFAGAVYALRARSWKPALFLLPGVVHSAVLFAVNIGQGLRYQYPVHLLAMFAIALLFLPKTSAGKAEREEKDLTRIESRMTPMTRIMRKIFYCSFHIREICVIRSPIRD